MSTTTTIYDHMGRRIEKATWEKTILTKRRRYIYLGYVQIAEIDATDETTPYVTKTYRWDPSEPVATRPLALSLWTREGTVRETLYYAHDLRKNVVSLFDANGMRRASYEYDPYGNITAMEGDMASENPYRFSSEHHDEDLGLVYYNYRHYNPTDGRWTSRDPIAEQGGWNLYGFVGNRPIDHHDMVGLDWNWGQNQPEPKETGPKLLIDSKPTVKKQPKSVTVVKKSRTDCQQVYNKPSSKTKSSKLPSNPFGEGIPTDSHFDSRMIYHMAIEGGAIWMHTVLWEYEARVRENRNPKISHPAIIRYISAHPASKSKTDILNGLDELVPWCACFSGYVLVENDYPLPKGSSLWALNYAEVQGWKKITQPKFGAMAVFSRQAEQGGHVGFLVGVSQTHYYVLGGNQGDCVKISAYPIKPSEKQGSLKIKGFYYPSDLINQAIPPLDMDNEIIRKLMQPDNTNDSTR